MRETREGDQGEQERLREKDTGDAQTILIQRQFGIVVFGEGRERGMGNGEWGMGNECPTHPKRIFTTCGELSCDMFTEFVSGDSQISPRVGITACGLTRASR